MKIPHVDVAAQYAPLRGELEAAFAKTLDTGRFIFGPEVEAFEREAAERLGVAECVSCANGTDALVLALDALGVGADAYARARAASKLVAVGGTDG